MLPSWAARTHPWVRCSPNFQKRVLRCPMALPPPLLRSTNSWRIIHFVHHLLRYSRGGCVHTADIITGLENGRIGYYGADVYENERGVFFYDHSDKEIRDPMLKKLLSMPNVLVTPHQAFATQEALGNIATATFDHIGCWENGQDSLNELTRASYEIDLQHQQLCNAVKT